MRDAAVSKIMMAGHRAVTWAPADGAGGVAADTLPEAESFRFPEHTNFHTKALREAADLLRTGDDGAARAYLVGWLDKLLQDQARPEGVIDSRSQVNQIFRATLEAEGITGGKIAELGGPYNSDRPQYPDFEWEFLSLFPVDGRDDVVVCDITRADHVPDNSYDAIFSISVMEHVAQPWLAAEHMMRILKPGGVMFHVAPFAYFYHGAPADFWRYTPDGFMALFPELRIVDAQILTANRRRDNRGSKANPVDKDGGAAFAVDSLGGWRENWLSYYCAVKDPAHAARHHDTARDQLVVDLMKQYHADGMTVGAAATLVTTGLARVCLTLYGGLRAAEPGTGIDLTVDAAKNIWKERQARGLEFSYARFSLRHQFEHIAFGGPGGVADVLKDMPVVMRVASKLRGGGQ